MNLFTKKDSSGIKSEQDETDNDVPFLIKDKIKFYVAKFRNADPQYKLVFVLRAIVILAILAIAAFGAGCIIRDFFKEIFGSTRVG